MKLKCSKIVSFGEVSAVSSGPSAPAAAIPHMLRLAVVCGEFILNQHFYNPSSRKDFH